MSKPPSSKKKFSRVVDANELDDLIRTPAVGDGVGSFLRLTAPARPPAVPATRISAISAGVNLSVTSEPPTTPGNGTGALPSHPSLTPAPGANNQVQTLPPPDANFAPINPDEELGQVQSLYPPGVNFAPPTITANEQSADRIQTFTLPDANFEPVPGNDGLGANRVQTLSPLRANFDPPVQRRTLPRYVDASSGDKQVTVASSTQSSYRARKVGLVQTALTSAERGVFDGLWRIGMAALSADTSLPWIDVTAGLKRLRDETALALNSCRNGIRGLIEKKVIDVLQEQVSETCTGRTYRVYSFDSIRSRWKEAHLEFILMKRGGGREFCTMDGNEIHRAIEAANPNTHNTAATEPDPPDANFSSPGCKL